MTLIIFFTTCSFIYLSTLSHFANYKYFNTVFLTEVVLVVVTFSGFYTLSSLLLIQLVSIFLYVLMGKTVLRN